MKNKKKILSLIACLSLLSSCNKGTSSNSSCTITTSTPTSSVTPSKTVEELNKELFENYANIVQSTGSLYNFLDNIPDEYLNLETIIIPEKVNGITINTLNNPSSGLFKKFTKLKTIKIPATINVINYNDSYSSKDGSPFINIPNLENIEVDSNNKWYYTKGNCLIQRVWRNQDGNRVPTGTYVAICGWKDVVIPEEITTLRNLAFTWNISITSITLHNNLTITKGDNNDKYYTFCNLDKLTSINPNGNEKYIVEEGTNILYDKDMASDNQYKIIVAWGDSVVPSSLNSVVAFPECTSLKSVDLTTNNVVKIGDYGFQNTQIEKINIPASITSIGSYAFLKMPYLSSLTADNNSRYVVEINEDGKSTNCLVEQSTNYLKAAWGDVIIPDSINNLQNNFDFSNFSSIKSIKLNKKLKNIWNLASSPFTNINRYSSTFKEKRTIDEYFELIDNEENPYFRVINNCLVDVLNKAVICAFPDKKTGIVTFPDGYTTLKNGFRQDFFMSDLKGIDFNDIENIEAFSLVYDKDDNSQITEINLPSKLKSCSTYSGTMFLTNFTNIQTLTFDGKSSNEYFRIENNLLIENATDKLLFGFGDCKIPDNIKNLTDCPFLSKSIKSVEVHPYLESFVVGSSHGSFKSIPCNNFIFNGTLEQLKRQITVSETQTKSILDELKVRIYTDYLKTQFKVTYLDENGNKVTKTLAEIE